MALWYQVLPDEMKMTGVKDAVGVPSRNSLISYRTVLESNEASGGDRKFLRGLREDGVLGVGKARVNIPMSFGTLNVDAF